MAYRIINKFDQSYSPDDLVFIEKGALLKKDNEDTKYLQLKFKNNSKEILSNVSITILLFDEAENQLGEQYYEYKGMFVPGGENFGVKTAIPLIQAEVYSVKILINNSQYIGIKDNIKHKDMSIGGVDFRHLIILSVIVATLFLQFNNQELAFYSRFRGYCLEVGFVALIIYPIVSFVLCSKLEYGKNLIWSFVSLIGLVIQIMLRTYIFSFSFYEGIAIDIISNIVIFGLAGILMFQSKTKKHLIIIVANEFLYLYLVIINIIREKGEYTFQDDFQGRMILLFVLSVITILINCYILKKIKHNKILTCIFLVISISLAIIFNRPYTEDTAVSYRYQYLLCNFIYYETIGFSFVLMLDWIKDKYPIRKRSK